MVYGKIRMGEKWWRWDEEDEILRNEKGKVRRDFLLEVKERGKGRVGMESVNDAFDGLSTPKF